MCAASRRIRRLGAVLLHIVVLGAPAAPALAQQPSGAAPEQGTTSGDEPAERQAVPLPGVTVRGLVDQPYRVDEVLSGTKTKTPQLDIPNSVQVVPGKVIEEQQDLRLMDVLRNVPGVSVPFTFGGRQEQFVIRGFTTNNGANTYWNFFRDDFFSGSRAARDLQNIDRVEVVKGPASVLYGRMDPGGAILMFTKQPLDQFYLNGQMIFGNYNFYRPTLDVSAPLTDSKALLGRFNAAYETADSFRDFVHTERALGAPVLTWRISPSTVVTLEGQYLYSDIPIDRGLVAVNQGVANIPISTFLGDPNKRDISNQGKVSLVLNHAFNESWSLRSGFRYAIAQEDYNSIEAGFLEGDNRTLVMDAFILPQTFQSYDLQNDVVGTFKTGPISHQLLVGLELAQLTGRQKVKFAEAGTMDIFNPTYDFAVGPFALTFDGSDRTNEVGLYVQDQVTLLPGLKAVAGLRFDYVNQVFRNHLARTEDTQEDNALTPRVGVLYQPIPTVSFYFNYNQSFIPQFGTTFSGQPFDPETAEQFEVGAKASFLDGKLLATLALFQINKKNVLTADPTDPLFSINAGSQRSRGIELDLTGQILPGWNVIATYAFIDALITESNDFPVGNTLPNVPTNSGSLWTTYTIQSGPLRGLGFGAGLFAAGRRFGDLNNSFELPSYVRTDLALYYTRGPFYGALNLKNVADVTYFQGAQSRTQVVPGEPFTVFGSLGVRF